MTTPSGDNARILILAPIGRDAPATAALLRRAGLNAEVCADLSGLVLQLDEAAVVLIAEEALFAADLSVLATWVERQPAWSDLPFIVLTSHQDQTHVFPWRQ